MRARLLFAAVLLAAASLFLTPPPARAVEPVTVFAAASLRNALDEVIADWKAKTAKTVRVSYAGSSALAKQIEQGAPADIFISANIDWMDHLQKAGLMKSETRGDLLGNSIVLISPKAEARPVEIRPGFPLAEMLDDRRLAMADTSAVPAGKYGKAALLSLGVWNAVEGKVAQAENVRAALALVSRGEVPYGIVYATDAAADPHVAIVGRFPADSHPPIIYPAAILAESKNPDAAAFLTHVKSPKMKSVFEKHGFTVLGQ